MEKYLNENLLDGEQILWKGRSAPFKLLAPPYSRTLPILWSASLLVLVGFVFLFIPFARYMHIDSIQILLTIVLAAWIPFIIGLHAVADKNTIEKHVMYVFTNYRAITLTSREMHSMLINASTPYRLELLPDGNEILYIGDACNTKSYASRANTITGIHKGNRKSGHITGLVFYGLRDALDICRQYTPFTEV